MGRPPTHRLATISRSVLLAAIVLASPVAAQGPEMGVSPVEQALGAMLVMLVVGGGLIAFAPTFTDRTTRLVHEKPVETLLYGFVIVIVLTIALFVLIVTFVGILLAIPLALLIVALSGIGYLAPGRAVSDNWGVALLVAMGTSAVVGGVPILGALLGVVLSSFGLGSAYLYYRSEDRSPSERPGDGERNEAVSGKRTEDGAEVRTERRD